MTRTELIVQLLKVAIGLAFGAYFVWWSLEVLDRLAPENEAPTPALGHMKVHATPVGSPSMWTLAFGCHEDRTPTHGYATTLETAKAAFVQELAAGVKTREEPSDPSPSACIVRVPEPRP
jgi:hypothetical protein